MELMNREESQVERAGRVKNLMKGFAKNLVYFLCLMAPVVVVGSVWFDIKPAIALRTIYGGLPLLVVFVMAERAMMDIGAEAGKKDGELTEARVEFRGLRTRAVEVGTADMGEFIREEIDAELESVRRNACRKLRISYDVYLAECLGKSKKELRRHLGSRVLAAKVYAIHLIRPIALTEDMILSDSSTSGRRGGIGKTGDDYCDEKKGLKNTVWSIVSIFLFTGIAFGPIREFSWAVVAYTVWALALLLYRMARGYKDGVVAYAEVQVRNYRDRSRYLEKYLEWRGKRITVPPSKDEIPQEISRAEYDYILTTKTAQKYE